MQEEVVVYVGGHSGRGGARVPVESGDFVYVKREVHQTQRGLTATKQSKELAYKSPYKVLTNQEANQGALWRKSRQRHWRNRCLLCHDLLLLVNRLLNTRVAIGALVVDVTLISNEGLVVGREGIRAIADNVSEGGLGLRGSWAGAAAAEEKPGQCACHSDDVIVQEGVGNCRMGLEC